MSDKKLFPSCSKALNMAIGTVVLFMYQKEIKSNYSNFLMTVKNTLRFWKQLLRVHIWVNLTRTVSNPTRVIKNVTKIPWWSFLFRNKFVESFSPIIISLNKMILSHYHCMYLLSILYNKEIYWIIFLPTNIG